MKWIVVVVEPHEKLFAVKCKSTNEYCVFSSEDLMVQFGEQLIGDFESTGVSTIETLSGRKHTIDIKIVQASKTEALTIALAGNNFHHLRNLVHR